MQVSDFHNKHQGRLAFVLGSGPSLHVEKLSGITDFVTFAVNASLMKVRQADYFVSDWPGVDDWEYYHKTLPKFSGTTFLPNPKYEHLAYHISRLVLYDSKNWFDPATKSINPEALKMTSDPKLPIVSARSSCGAAVHLAHLMGCDPIVLVGNDCCHMGEYSHYYQFPGEYKLQRYRGHPIPSRTTMLRGKMIDDDNRAVIDYWHSLAADNPYINIINTCQQGMLTCFPRMSLVDVMTRYKGLRKALDVQQP